MQWRKAMFQSTPPREGRPAAFFKLCARATVSIHAPARGATIRYASTLDLRGFNPRPRARGDARATEAALDHREGFYPRPRARGDLHGRRRFHHHSDESELHSI